MDKLWACITNDVVENIIVADDAFISVYRTGAGARFNAILRVDELTPQPAIGWGFANGEFIEPVLQDQ
jgi:hypothetical protein